MKTKTTTISILIAGVFIGGAIMFGGQSASKNSSPQAVNNVSIVDGKQIITINAKGGYSPSITTAKADVPTILRVQTNGTYDCTSILRVPSIGYQKNLPPTGITDIELSPQEAGAKIQGMCGMGMYSFSIYFN